MTRLLEFVCAAVFEFAQIASLKEEINKPRGVYYISTKMTLVGEESSLFVKKERATYLSELVASY